MTTEQKLDMLSRATSNEDFEAHVAPIFDALSDDDFEAYLAVMLGEPVERLAHFGEGLPLVETERIIRSVEACRLLGVSKSTLYRMTLRGDIMKPRRISHRVAGWPLRELIEWRDRQPGGP